MDAHEIHNLSALVETSKIADDSIGKLFDEAVRDSAIIFSHNSGCCVQSGLNCSCSIARMNINELGALSDAALSGLDGLSIKPTIQVRLSEKENRILSNISSFFMLFTGTRTGRGQAAVPKPLAALRMMTTGDEAGRPGSF